MSTFPRSHANISGVTPFRSCSMREDGRQHVGFFFVRKKIYEMKMRVEGSHLTTRVSAIAKEVFNGICLSCRRRAQQSSLEAS